MTPSTIQRPDQLTGLLAALTNWLRRPVIGGPAWSFVWPATIAFTLLVQAITGLAIWMYYSPGAQSSWESVYYLQYHVQAGWLLRAIHYYAGQAMLVLIGVYLAQMVLRGACRAPRAEMVSATYVAKYPKGRSGKLTPFPPVPYWTVLLMALTTLGLNLTGDLLPWDQNSYWATNIRIGYLAHTPVAGPWLAKLALGGTQIGTLSLTRFLVLHAGVFAMALLGLIMLHSWISAAGCGIGD